MAYRLSDRHNQVRRISQGDEESFLYIAKKTSIIFFAFGVLSLLTSLFYGSGEKNVFSKTVDLPTNSRSEIVGPIKINDKGKIHSVTSSLVTNSSWSVSLISGELLDSNKKTLYSFAMELYPKNDGAYESGSTNGHKYKSGDSFTTDFIIKDKGLYYLKFSQDSNPSGELAPKVAIKVVTKKYSPIPHRILAVILIIIGFIVRFLPSNFNGRSNITSSPAFMSGLFIFTFLIFGVFAAIFLMVIISIVKNFINAKNEQGN